MRVSWVFLSLLVWLGAQPVLAAETAIGSIKTLEGAATITRGEVQLPARIGAPLRRNDVIETAADSALGITLRDETMLSIGPDTEIALDQYAFVPAEEKYSLVARISRGTLFYVSGLIAKLSPSSASVVTPGGTIGVRGTRFAVRIQ